MQCNSRDSEATDVVVIGAGYAGLTAACYAARQGKRVLVLEALPTAGGRNQAFEVKGYRFERGPSWLWMLDVHEQFYRDMGKSMKDYLSIERLDPAYRVFFPDDAVDVPNGVEEFGALLEELEPGAAIKFEESIRMDRYRYEQAMESFIELPSLHFGEYLKPQFWRHLPYIGLFRSQKAAVRSKFKDERVRQLLEWPTIFVGHSPEHVPELYSLLNWAAIAGGTWFPKNGMYDTIRGMEKVCCELGVEIRYNHHVSGIRVDGGAITSVKAQVQGRLETIAANQFIVTCDMAFFERSVVPKSLQMYTPEYWDSREVSPACLLFYVGVKTKVLGLKHHNLFFDRGMYQHMHEIWNSKRIPTNPLFYVSLCSETNGSFAPDGCDALFILIPMPHIPLTAETKDQLFHMVMFRIEQRIKQELRAHIEVKQEFDYADFCKTYHSLSGNGFGLSNTRLQSAFFKPSMRSTTIRNLVYAGQTTAPGGGVPTSMLSGKMAASLVADDGKPSLLEQGLIRLTQSLRSLL